MTRRTDTDFARALPRPEIPPPADCRGPACADLPNRSHPVGGGPSFQIADAWGIPAYRSKIHAAAMRGVIGNRLEAGGLGTDGREAWTT